MSQTQKFTATIIFVLLATILSIAAYNLYSPEPRVNNDENADTVEITQNETTAAPNNWPIYRHPDFTFSIPHPPESTVVVENQRVKVTYLGPDNTMDSEITDGFTLFASTIEADTDSTEDITQSLWDDQLTQTEPVEAPHSITLNNRPAKRFVVRTQLGPLAEHTILQTSNNTYLHFTATIIDPNEQNYRDTVETIILNTNVD